MLLLWFFLFLCLQNFSQVFKLLQNFTKNFEKLTLYSVSSQFFQNFFTTKNNLKLHHVWKAPSRELEVFRKFH